MDRPVIARMLVTCLLILCSSFGWAESNPSIETDTEEYVLGPADELEIFVWKEEELNKTVVVRPDGGISFPLAGDISVAGRTIKQVQADLVERLSVYIPAAVVTVSVTKVAGYRIYILGEVKNPGEYVLGSYVTVAQALTLADGLTPYASKGGIKIVRQVDGKDTLLFFDYGDFMKGKNLEQNIKLRSRDTVVVP